MAEKIILMRTEGASAPAPESDRSSTTWNHWTGEDGRLLARGAAGEEPVGDPAVSGLGLVALFPGGLA